MAKYAVIDSSNKVGNIVEADSLEAAKEFFLGKFDVSDVIDPSEVEGGDLVAIGVDWDGEKLIPLQGTELDELHPTTFEGIVEE